MDEVIPIVNGKEEAQKETGNIEENHTRKKPGVADIGGKGLSQKG